MDLQMIGLRVCVLGVMIGLVAASVHTQDAQVSGTLAVNGKQVPVGHISAVAYDTPSPGRLVSVLVSDKPADPKTFREYTKLEPGEPYTAARVFGAWVTMHMDKAFSGFHFTINAQREVILNDVLVGSRDDNFSIYEGHLVLELTSSTPRLVGRLRTKEPVVDLGSQKIGIDLTFDVPVTELK
jgi:hypothetical protein